MTTSKTRVIVAGAAVIALCLGLLAGYLLFRADGSDAAVACDRAADVGDINKDELSPDRPLPHRLTGIGGFAMAAAADDDEYEALGERGLDLITGLQMLDVEKTAQALDDLRAECDDLGL